MSPTSLSSAHPTVLAMDYDLTGVELGPWLLQRVLGEGAMGKVYVARHQRIGRVAAVKVLKAEHAQNPDLVQRFIAEATAVNAIKNEHIVEVFDFGEQLRPDGSLVAYCVMELLEGRPLSDVMAEHFTLARALKICFQLSKALHAAHQIGVVHRDIKPENMFLARRGDDPEFLKVLDFGIAKLLKPIGDIPQSGTAAGIVIGTPEYMAPEQALGSPTDRRADIYAAGLVAYELLSGVQPFHGDTFGKLLVEITSRAPPPLPDQNARGEAIHPTLKAIVYRCLEKEPERRFQSAEELTLALEPFLTGGPIRQLATPTPQAALASTAPMVLPAAASEAPLVVEKSKAPLIVAGLLGAALLAGLAFVLLPARSPPVTAPQVELAPPIAPLPAPEIAPPVAAPTVVTLEVRSTPPGARVVDVTTGAALGVTPLTVEHAAVESLLLRLSLDGHESAERTVKLTANTSLEVDLPKTIKQDVAVPLSKTKTRGKKPVSRDGVVDPFNQ